jgi:2-polyprenyl-3-methyl-5-hydroxy-6-metoxy-1,4-benzoquinol methylase
MFKRNYLRFPLFYSDEIPIEKISKNRIDAIRSVKEKIFNKEYRYVENICLCGDKDKDILISEKDRYGFDVKFLLCKKCSLIRVDRKLDCESLSDFYSNYYRKIYGDGSLSIEKEFFNQTLKGTKYKKLLEKYIDFSKINNVIDIGCGTGGVLKSFKEMGKNVYGIDYDIDRLRYGSAKGFKLLHAIDDKNEIENKKYELIILSHVMEHLSSPINEMNDIFEMLSDNGIIHVVVPSPMYIGRSPRVTSRFFQNVHLYNFNKDYLSFFFNELNMDVLFIDDECNCILRKPKNWIRNDLDSFFHDELSDRYKLIRKHFFKVVIMNDIFKFNIIYYYFLGHVVRILDFLNLKDLIKKLFNK